jgi:hypothetical protein
MAQVEMDDAGQGSACRLEASPPAGRFTVKYLVKTPITSDAKTRWHTIGRAYDDREGTGRIVVVLDSIPFRSEFVYLYPEDEGEKRTVQR